MCVNNVGVAHADLGDASSARDAWEHALALDPLYPVPYANLAALAAADGNVDQATSLLLRARQLGYTGGSLVRATHRVQQLSADRKRDEWGKSASLRVDLGGSRIIKKKNSSKRTNAITKH